MNIQFVRVRFANFDTEWTFAVFGEKRDMTAVIQGYVDDAKRIYKWDEDQDDGAIIADVMDQLLDAGYVFRTVTIDEVLVD